MENYNNTLSKFGVVIDGKSNRTKFTHLSNRFRIKFEGFATPMGGENLTMDAKSVSEPKGKFDEHTLETATAPIYYPGLWKWDPLDITIYNSYDNLNYKTLQRQIMTQKDSSTQITGTVPQNYKFVTQIERTDGEWNPISTWVLEGCWLVSANASDMEYGKSDPSEIKISMRFDNAALYDYDGTIISSDGAVSTLLDKILAY